MSTLQVKVIRNIPQAVEKGFKEGYLMSKYLLPFLFFFSSQPPKVGIETRASHILDENSNAEL